MAERRLRAILVGIMALGALAFVAVGLIFADSLPGRLLTGGGLRPGPKQPTAGPAVVDGNQGEWILAEDHFADLYGAGQEDREVAARLYLRYDCRTNLMYVLCLSAGEGPILLQRSQVRLALDTASQEVAAVGFAWLEPGYDGNRQHTQGWEASFAATPGEHLLWATAPVPGEGAAREVHTPDGGTAMALACDHPTNLFLKRLEAMPNGERIRVVWETAWEMNNLGFNVYHGRGRDGPWTKLNRDLVGSRAARDGTTGAEYEFVHTGADLDAENYYLLEDVAGDGIPTRHGPITP